jgi:SAM-dependent methyltransferase
MCSTDGRPNPEQAVRYDGGFFSEGWFRNWDMLKHVLCNLLESDPKWRAIVDYGCGPGIMIDLMNSRGLDYLGCDVSPEARDLYLRHFGKNPEKYVSSIAALPDRTFDLLISFDVFEHMRDEEIAGLLDRIPCIPEILVNISRVRSIPGHVNLKPDRAWIRFFESHGWMLRRDGTEALRARYLRLRPDGSDLWHKNMFLFNRAAGPD